MTAKHSPGKLRFERDTYNVPRLWTEDDNDVAAVCGDGSIPSEVEEANAHRLVLCWNTHDELVEAAKSCLALIPEVPKTQRPWLDLVQAVRKAEGK